MTATERRRGRSYGAWPRGIVMPHWAGGWSARRPRGLFTRYFDTFAEAVTYAMVLR